jgi:hypothetical protein
MSMAQLIVVAHQQETLESVARHLAGVPGVEIVRERRVTDRRQSEIAWGDRERRRRERRSNSLDGSPRVMYVH